MPLTKVSSGVIAANAVVDSFGTQSITGDKIGLGAITGNTLAPNIINANNIVNASITGAKIALGTITGDDIATGQITGNLLTANCVSGNNIVSSPTITGNVTINGSLGIGGATTPSSGVGIKFPGTQVASTDANTLDDYEEGTWTPTYFGSSTPGTTTYTYQAGSYVKIGNSVYCECYLEWSAKTGTGDGLLGGLPFTVGLYTQDSRPLFFMGAYGGYSITGSLTGIVVQSGTSVLLYAINNGSLAGSAIQNSGLLRFQFFYRSAN